jgi:hypothetical protein
VKKHYWEIKYIRIGGEILYTPQVKVIHQDHSTFKKMPSIHTYNITKESYKVYKKLL